MAVHEGGDVPGILIAEEGEQPERHVVLDEGGRPSRYIYYHCSGAKGKCDEPYTREEVLEDKFGELLKAISLELARDAYRLYQKQEPRGKRRLLDFVRSNCTWQGGELQAEYRQLLDLIAENAAVAAKKKQPQGAASSFSEIWLPGVDSNHGPSD